MYRAIDWLALQEQVDINDGPALAQLARTSEIVISPPQVEDGRAYTVMVRGRDITWDIRSPAVTRTASGVSARPEVRAVLIAQQRAMAQRGHVVMVGRDIGAVVLPDAELKIYLIASLEERARRRHAELVAQLGEHNPALPSMLQVMSDIQHRDDFDRDNMQPAADAIIVDTDNLNISQVLEIICRYVEDKT
jgi:cytidylate kinase